MDWTIFHWLNDATRGSEPAQDAAQIVNAWAIFVLVGISGSLWLLARPGGPLRWKLATASAALAAVIGLAANALLSMVWYDARPFVTHPKATLLLVGHSRDNGFPSEHATVAFAIAFAVLAFSRRLGILLVLAATAIALDRIFVGVHYPADVAVSLLVGLAAALLVTAVGRRYVTTLVLILSPVIDPIVTILRRPVTR